VLLLLTVGLLLIGLVTLVIGFLNSSLALDYISIAASALSFALVLVFTRLGRARSARAAATRGRQVPAPLASSDTGDTGLIELDTSDSLEPETTAYPRASRATRASRVAEAPRSEVFDELPAEEEEEGDDAIWEPEPAPPVAAPSARSRSPYERPSARDTGVGEPMPPAPVGRFDEDRYEDESDEGAPHLPEYEDLEFPIADYDELRVAEILPLLEELEPDEIEVVRDREMSGRNRAVVLHKLDELTGGAPAPPAPPAGRRPAAPVVNGVGERPAVERPAVERPAVERPAVQRPAVERPAVERPAVERPAVERPAVERPAVERPAEIGYDDEDAGYGDGYDSADEEYDEEYDEGGRGAHDVEFPIADYDDLRLTEILPLLPQLEPVELEMVRQRELEGERRATLLNRIDALIGTGAARTPARQSR
jgi:hypothetical protein